MRDICASELSNQISRTVATEKKKSEIRHVSRQNYQHTSKGAFRIFSTVKCPIMSLKKVSVMSQGPPHVPTLQILTSWDKSTYFPDGLVNTGGGGG